MVAMTLDPPITITAHVNSVGQANSENTAPGIFSQVKLFNLHPLRTTLKDERLELMMQEGGIAELLEGGELRARVPEEVFRALRDGPGVDPFLRE